MRKNQPVDYKEVMDTLELLIKTYKVNIGVKQLVKMVYFKRYSPADDISAREGTITSTSTLPGIKKSELQKVANLILEADALVTRYDLTDKKIRLILKQIVEHK